MDVKETARCIFHVMVAFGVPQGKALRALLLVYDITMQDIAKRADVSVQFVGQWLAGRRSSEKVSEVVKEILFGKGSSVEISV